FHVHHPRGLVVRGDDGRHARLGVVRAIAGLPAGGDDFHRLPGLAVHARVPGRPVGATGRVPVFLALELGTVPRAGIGAQANGRDGGRFRIPHVDDGGQAIAADGVDIAAGGGQTRDVHRVAGIEDLPDLVGITVDQRELAGVTQGDGEDVLQVDLVHL